MCILWGLIPIVLYQQQVMKMWACRLTQNERKTTHTWTHSISFMSNVIQRCVKCTILPCRTEECCQTGRGRQRQQHADICWTLDSGIQGIWNWKRNQVKFSYEMNEWIMKNKITAEASWMYHVRVMKTCGIFSHCLTTSKGYPRICD